MARFKYKAGSEASREAAANISGGDLQGSDFREKKKEINQQRRLNRRALRRARRKGGTAESYGYDEFTPEEQKANEYFKHLHKGRSIRIGAGIAAAAAAPALIAGMGAGAAGTAGALTSKTAIGGALKGAGAKIGASYAAAGGGLSGVNAVASPALKAYGTANALIPKKEDLMDEVEPTLAEQPAPPQILTPSQSMFGNQMYQGYGLGMAFPQMNYGQNPYSYGY